MKLTVEDQDLRKSIVEYLAVNGTEVDDDTPVAITLPGAGNSPQRCMSGSGLMTAGGKFAPGYDAKLKSALYAIIRGEPNKIPTELLEHGPMYRPVEDWTVEEATKVLDEFNWPYPTIKPVKEKKVKAEKSEDDDESEDGEAGTSTGASTRAGRKKAAKEAAAKAATAEGEDESEPEEVVTEA